MNISKKLCLNVIFSGERSICQGGNGVEQGPAGYSMQEVDDVFAPPLTSTPRQQPTQPSTSFKVPKLAETSFDSFNNNSQHLESLPAKCDHCGFVGDFGNHLRETFSTKKGSFIQCRRAFLLDASLDASVDNSVDHPNAY